MADRDATVVLAALLRDRSLGRMSEAATDAVAAAREGRWDVARDLLREAGSCLDQAEEQAGEAGSDG